MSALRSSCMQVHAITDERIIRNGSAVEQVQAGRVERVEFDRACGSSLRRPDGSPIELPWGAGAR